MRSFVQKIILFQVLSILIVFIYDYSIRFLGASLSSLFCLFLWFFLVYKIFFQRVIRYHKMSPEEKHRVKQVKRKIKVNETIRKLNREGRHIEALLVEQNELLRNNEKGRL